jgi:ribonuclease-3
MEWKMKDFFDIYKLNSFENKLGYVFKKKELLVTALTHTSFSNEESQKQMKNIESNERMEFLGDSVLSTCVSSYLYKNFSDMPEGKLSKLRAALVC